MHSLQTVRALFSVGCVFLLWACGDGNGVSDPPLQEEVRLEIFSEPQISYEQSVGTTTIVVQFAARDQRGLPLEASDLDVTMFVDDRAIDVEGLLQEDSEELRSDLRLSMVLDASYSMLQHQPPAFGPMLSAAKRTVASARSLYLNRPGVFGWNLFWFDDQIHTPLITTPETRWTEADIELIPAPDAGTFTKLYGALDAAIREAAESIEASPPGPRDRYLLVAFSDGADNYSWFGNAELQGSGTIGGNRSYRSFGYAATKRDDVIALLGQNPKIQLHVIGLGSAVNDADLQALAQAGQGRYYKNIDPAEIDGLFDQVIAEFTSVQSHGVTVPLPPGNYGFRLRVQRSGSPAHAEYAFQFRGGETGARLLP